MRHLPDTPGYMKLVYTGKTSSPFDSSNLVLDSHGLLKNQSVSKYKMVGGARTNLLEGNFFVQREVSLLLF